jgi:hypothetical protein
MPAPCNQPCANSITLPLSYWVPKVPGLCLNRGTPTHTHPHTMHALCPHSPPPSAHTQTTRTNDDAFLCQTIDPQIAQVHVTESTTNPSCSPFCAGNAWTTLPESSKLGQTASSKAARGKGCRQQQGPNNSTNRTHTSAQCTAHPLAVLARALKGWLHSIAFTSEMSQTHYLPTRLGHNIVSTTVPVGDPHPQTGLCTAWPQYCQHDSSCG